MLWAVLGAIAGGILLNLMPCVFPILALKALHLSRAGRRRRARRARDALAYAAGAIVGTGALGAVLLAIRAAGAEAGWAFQLQDPRTIMLLLLLAVAITANLLGLFELPVLGGSAQPAGSFGTGALAAFVATPCAGPFLGAALGRRCCCRAAGRSRCSPRSASASRCRSCCVAFVPALRSRLPKPGPWMDRLKRFLAIPMAASALPPVAALPAGGAAGAVARPGAAALGLLLVAVRGRSARSAGGASASAAHCLRVALTALSAIVARAAAHRRSRANWRQAPSLERGARRASSVAAAGRSSSISPPTGA